MKLRRRPAISTFLAQIITTVAIIGIFSGILMAEYMFFQATLLNPRQYERFAIEDVWFKDGGKVQIAVRNWGTREVKLMSVIIGDVDVSDSMSPRPVSIPSRARGVVTVAFDWATGESYNVIVISERYNTATIVATA